MRAFGALILLCAVVVLPACGGSSSTTRVSAPPLPSTVAESLASESDAVAASLASHDACASRAHFHRLARDAQHAVSTGAVPGAYRTQLLAAVRRLGDRLPVCTPPPPPPPPPPAKPEPVHHGKGNEKPHKHGKHHWQHGEDEQ